MDNRIGYHLTRTVPGPKLKTENPKQGFDIIRNWTKQFTVGKYLQFSLHLKVPADNYPDLEFLDKEFLRQKVSGFISHGGNIESHVCEWIVVYALMPELFELIDKRIDFFRQYEFSIMISIDFIMLDEKGQLLKEQNLYEGPHSNLYAFIYENELHIEPALIFPFTVDDKKFRKFYKYFKTNFPFKLNDRNLYIYGRHAKTGKSFSRKLAS